MKYALLGVFCHVLNSYNNNYSKTNASGKDVTKTMRKKLKLVTNVLLFFVVLLFITSGIRAMQHKILLDARATNTLNKPIRTFIPEIKTVYMNLS